MRSRRGLDGEWRYNKHGMDFKLTATLDTMDSSSPIATKPVPKVVLNTPVEIWQEIIDWVLFDLVIFLTDPFFPGCNLHTALNDWTDSRRLRNHEVQRGHLRLVSHAWKTLIDSSSYRYFEPYGRTYVDQIGKYSQPAHRLEFHHRCGLPIVKGRVESCASCELYSGLGIESIVFQQCTPLNAKILRFPRWWQSGIYLDPHQSAFYDYFPNLRALFISADEDSLNTVSKLFINLTFLSLRKEKGTRTYSTEEYSPLVLPKLKTFQFHVTYNSDVGFLKEWSMPSLAHIDLIVEVPRTDLSDICTLFLDIGHSAQSIRISGEMEFLPFPSEIWEKMPLLEYLALSTLDRPDNQPPVLPSPPPNHPFHTLATIWDEVYMHRAREDVHRVIGKWKGLGTIADSHSWESMPKTFLENWEEHGPIVKVPAPSYASAWEYVALLQLSCTEHGLRYEDCSGRTFAQFQAQYI